MEKWTTPRGGAATAPLGNLPVLHCPHREEFLPYFQSNPALCQFKTVIPCPVTTGSGEKICALILYVCILHLYGIYHPEAPQALVTLARPTAQGVQAGAAEAQHTPDHSHLPSSTRATASGQTSQTQSPSCLHNTTQPQAYCRMRA